MLQQNEQDENDLDHGVAARKRSESEYFLQICKYWLNYVLHIKTIEFLGCHISKNEIVSMKLQSF